MNNPISNQKYQVPGENLKGTAWHWYDLTCPFCYVSKSRSEILTENGFDVISLPFQAHPDIPSEGIYIGERKGPMYDLLEKEAAEAHLPLKWPLRLPNSRYALAVAEQLRRHFPDLFSGVKARLYAAHFALGEDLGSKTLVDSCVKEFGIEERQIDDWMKDGAAFRDVETSEDIARGRGVNGTPAWIVEGKLISGLQLRSVFSSFKAGQ